MKLNLFLRECVNSNVCVIVKSVIFARDFVNLIVNREREYLYNISQSFIELSRWKLHMKKRLFIVSAGSSLMVTYSLSDASSSFRNHQM